jgi:hypothetical protein
VRTSHSKVVCAPPGTHHLQLWCVLSGRHSLRLMTFGMEFKPGIEPARMNGEQKMSITKKISVAITLALCAVALSGCIPTFPSNGLGGSLYI